MPLFEIDLTRDAYERDGDAISTALLQAQSDALGVPNDDLFQIFRLHDSNELRFNPTYNAVDRRALIVIRVTAVRIYRAAEKNALFIAIVNGLEHIGVRRDDLLVLICENGWEDWFAGRFS